MLLIYELLILAKDDINQILPKHGCGRLLKEANWRALMHFIRPRRLCMSVQDLEPTEFCSTMWKHLTKGIEKSEQCIEDLGKEIKNMKFLITKELNEVRLEKEHVIFLRGNFLKNIIVWSPGDAISLEYQNEDFGYKHLSIWRIESPSTYSSNFGLKMLCPLHCCKELNLMITYKREAAK